MDATAKQQLAIYEDMIVSRRFDEFCQQRIDNGESFPHFHAGTGQEALSVTPVHTLQEDDRLLYTHRGYGHLIARGISLETIVSDMKYKTPGTTKGFGSVLHVNDPSKGVPGRNGVFGTRFTIASGLGLSDELSDDSRVILCFYGEAAGARGPLFEALNLMALRNLPVVLIAENNGFSISSRTEDIYAPGDMSTFAKGFDIPRQVVDGNDVVEVFDAVQEAVERARERRGPTIVEGDTYRIPPHIPIDDEPYRSEQDVKEQADNDPIERFRTHLRGEGILTDEKVSEIEATAEQRVEEAIEYGQSATDPEPDQALDYVYYRDHVTEDV